MLTATEAGAFCSKAGVITLHDAHTGKPTVLGGGGTDDVTQMLRVPGHLLVLRTDRSLESYDGKTGALVAKSTFPLELAFGHVVMQGHEAAQRYLEIFDPASGKRALADVVPLW